MAFIKQCIGTVKKCTKCGQTGIFNIDKKWYCQNCKEDLDKKPK